MATLVTLEVSFLALTAVFIGLDYGSLALVVVVAALACTFFRVRSSWSEADWFLHPLRILIPLLVTFQLIYWFWFGLLGDIRPATDWDWMLQQIDRRAMGGHLAAYLFRHVPLLIGLDLGLRTLRRQWATIERREVTINPIAVLVVSFLALTVATLGDAGLLSGNTVLAYLNTSTDRVFMTLYGLLVLLAVVPSFGKIYRISALVLITFGLGAGIALSITIGMRYVVFQQILIFVAILWTAGRIYERRAMSARLVLILALSFPLFGVLTAVKFSASGDTSEFQNIASGIQFVGERGLQRLAPFTTDALIAENRAADSLFTEVDSSMVRLASAVPLLNTTLSLKSQNSDSLEKRIYTYTSKHWASAGDVSVFISGASESVYAFGNTVGVLVIFLAGLLHGAVVSLSTRICGYINWVNVTSQYVLFALLGMDISNFIRLPVNILLGALVCYSLVHRWTHRPASQTRMG